MLQSMKTLVGALCVFASAFFFAAQVSANEDSGGPNISRVPSAGQATTAEAAPETKRGSGTKRHKTYASLVRKVAKKHGVPEKIALAVVQVESNFNPKARGGAGEIGLMQIKPATARGMGYRGSAKGLYDPTTNLEWGMRYLAGAHKRASGEVCGTILRYNAGHYAKRMNPVSRRYCQKVKQIIAGS